jgi:hypothetical protein
MVVRVVVMNLREKVVVAFSFVNGVIVVGGWR